MPPAVAVEIPDYRRIVTAAAVLSLVMGIGIISVGPCLPGLSDEFDLSDTAAGALVALQGGAYGAAVVVAGRIGDRIGRLVPTTIGIVMQIGGLVALALAQSAAWAFGAITLVGIGAGIASAGVGALVADNTGPRAPRAMLLSNAGFGLGALVAPGVAAIAFAVGLSWRWPLLVGAAVCLIALPTVRIFPRGRPRSHADAPMAPWHELLRDAHLRALLVVIGLYFPVESALAAWYPKYSVDARDGSEWMGAAAVAGFWAALTISRLILGLGRFRLRTPNLLPLLIGGALVLALGVLLLPGAAAPAFVLIVSGALCGGIFPLSSAAAAARAPAATGTVFGLLLGIGGVMTLVVPLTMGVVSDAAGTPAAGIVVVVVLLAAALAAALAYRSMGDAAPVAP